jgi:beta-glucosidase
MPSGRDFSRRQFMQLWTGAALGLASGTSGALTIEPADTPSAPVKEDAKFPMNFVWGAATAAYQIEGAAQEDGRGRSIWDVFCKKEGAVWQGNSGDVACDHYHRYKDDIALMKSLGLQAYRMSTSWPRILPSGTGNVNAKGLEFYDRLVDGLLAEGIMPWITLYHWDLPQDLFLKGGWSNAESPKWFEEYTRVLVERLSDRVSHWITFNEAQVLMECGHRIRNHAPGTELNDREMLLAAHHVLLAHGRSVRCIRGVSKQNAHVGWVNAFSPACPISEKKEDIEAARVQTFKASRDLWGNAWWTDPIVFGSYPEDGLRVFGGDVPAFTSEEMKTIREPIDFIGLNIYYGRMVRARDDGSPEVLPPPPGRPHTLFRWPVTPEALRWGPRFIYERYHLPIVITENGMSNPDWVQLDGRVNDPQRIDFLERYLGAYHQAIADGVDARGYFLWSLLDNFEWAEGYRERFGIVHVDFETQKRTPKESSKWYREVIKSHGHSLSIAKK